MKDSAAKLQDPASHSDEGERVDLAVLDRIIDRYGTSPSATIPILQAIQEHFRYLPQQALVYVCERLPPSLVPINRKLVCGAGSIIIVKVDSECEVCLMTIQ